MSGFQDDEDGNDITDLNQAKHDVDDISFFTDDAIEEIKGIVVGMEEEKKQAKPGEAMLDSDLGSTTRSYLNYWILCMENAEGLLDPKTTLGELLMFLANKQADMDLMHQGDKVQ